MSENKSGGIKKWLSDLFAALSCGLEKLGAKIERKNTPALTPLERDVEQLFMNALGAEPTVMYTRLSVLDTFLKDGILNPKDNLKLKGRDLDREDGDLGAAFSGVLASVFRTYSEAGILMPLFPALDRLAMELADRGYVQSAWAIMSEYGGQLLYVMRPEVQDYNPGVFMKYISVATQRLSETDPPGSGRREISDRRRAINVLYENLGQSSSLCRERNMWPDNVTAGQVAAALAVYPSAASGFATPSHPSLSPL